MLCCRRRTRDWLWHGTGARALAVSFERGDKLRPVHLGFAFAEVFADLPLAAGIRIGEGSDDVVAVPCAVPLLGIADLLHEMGQQRGVLFLPEQNAVGGIAIATGTPGFLVVLLDRFRQGHVN